MESQEAYFHIVRQPSSLQAVARLLYGGTDSAAARDFLRFNEVAADSSGYLAAGRIVYIPDAGCLAPALEAQIIEMVKRCNELMSARLSASQVRLLARHSNLINNAAGHSSMIRSVPRMVSKAAGGMLAAAQVEDRLMGGKLRELETLYKKSFQAHGRRLGPKFYAQRRRIYESLDTAAGRLARAIIFGTRLDENTRHALKVNTKSQLLHWRRRGTGGIYAISRRISIAWGG